MKITFTAPGWEDCTSWTHDRKMLTRTNRLLTGRHESPVTDTATITDAEEVTPRPSRRSAPDPTSTDHAVRPTSIHHVSGLDLDATG